MIIKSYRLRAKWSLRAFKRHVFRGRENETIAVLRGSEGDLDFYQRTARTAGRTHGIRHVIVASDEEIGAERLLQVADMLAKEFGFDPQITVCVLHRKTRKDGQKVAHLHLMVPETDPVSGKLLDSSHSFPRQEKIARIAEFRFGLKHLRGRHLPSVAKAAKAEEPDVYASLVASFPDLSPGTPQPFDHKGDVAPSA